MEERRLKEAILSGKTSLGIEFGSTRIKAVLVGEDNVPIASGSHTWENRYEDQIWTYHLEDIWQGLQDCYRKLAEDVEERYSTELTVIGSIGFSGMMHGYMVFDKDNNLLVPFRTWRNSMTKDAADQLTRLFHFNIPQRWSIAHLYQAILKKEEHITNIDFLTTLAGYIHWKLTGEKVLGIGEASGVFPIDSQTKNYHSCMIEQFNTNVASEGLPWKLEDILPKVLCAGERAGFLTQEGAAFLDPSGRLQPGSVFCPPEGDAGTGMVATNSVAQKTGNVSAGTSIFAMIVLEKELREVYPEIDMVTTPDGSAVAMVHANNCTSDLNAWVSLFGELAKSFEVEVDVDQLYGTLYRKSLEGDPDCGGLLSYGYFSGENITNMEEGRPLFVRSADSRFTLANFMRVHLYTAMGALKIGMDILQKEENVRVEQLFGHGGLFKTKGVGQRFMAGAMNAPVTVMETAGEGGAWGIALLASYMRKKKGNENLAEYLNDNVFTDKAGETLPPVEEDIKGFEQFMLRYKAGLAIERAAVDALK